MLDNERRWIVATTKQRCEMWAAQNVLNQNFELFVPRILRQTKQSFVAEAVFPGYIFVAYRPQWKSLLGTYGISSVMRRGEEPDTIPDRVIAQLRARLGADGYVRLPEHHKKHLKPGQMVVVLDGPFQHYSGLVQGMLPKERIKLLMDVLGRKTEILIDANAVALAA